MPTRERIRDRGQPNADREWIRVGEALRNERLSSGLSQSQVAAAAGLTQSRISRTERAKRTPPRLDELAQHCAALGLRLSAKAYPDGVPVRDAAQLRLLAKLRAQLHADLGWKTEVLVGGQGDQRAWDGVVFGQETVGVDAETRLCDIQALQRKVEAHWRDSGLIRVVLLVASTHRNRAILRDHRRALPSTFPLDTAAVMRALRSGAACPRTGS